MGQDSETKGLVLGRRGDRGRSDILARPALYTLHWGVEISKDSESPNFEEDFILVLL